MTNARVVLFILLLSLVAVAQEKAIEKDRLIQPAELAQLLQSKNPKPLIFNVGPRMLFDQAHITGSELIGPTSDPRALEALRTRVKSLPKKQSIILYCGCCPWGHCPNVEPAYQQLKTLGFTNVKVLYIANNIGADWVYKGYPTVKGQ